MRTIRWVGLAAIALLSGCGYYVYRRPPVYTTYQAPVYAQPTYVAPQPTYVAPQPVYVAPQPTYVAPQPTYVAPSTGAYGQVVTPYGGVRGAVIVNP
jgi:hypothetical protein